MGAITAPSLAGGWKNYILLERDTVRYERPDEDGTPSKGRAEVCDSDRRRRGGFFSIELASRSDRMRRF